VMEGMQKNAKFLAGELTAGGRFALVEGDSAQLPLVVFQLTGEAPYDEFDVSSQLAAERGWMVPAYSMPPNAQDVTIMRALVKENVGHAGARTLADDMERACELLDKRGESLPEHARRRVRRGPGY
jgi:glutamate decarboxylase